MSSKTLTLPDSPVSRDSHVTILVNSDMSVRHFWKSFCFPNTDISLPFLSFLFWPKCELKTKDGIVLSQL